MSFFSDHTDSGDGAGTDDESALFADHLRDAQSVLDALMLTSPPYRLRCRTKGCHADPKSFVQVRGRSPRPYCTQCAGDLLQTSVHAREYPIDVFESGDDATIDLLLEDENGRHFELGDESGTEWVVATNSYDSYGDDGLRSCVDVTEVV